jgi:hypothetical protein
LEDQFGVRLVFCRNRHQASPAKAKGESKC